MSNNVDKTYFLFIVRNDGAIEQHIIEAETEEVAVGELEEKLGNLASERLWVLFAYKINGNLERLEM